MKVVSTIEEVRKIVKEWKSNGFSVGLVPTMGYLHEGHASLIKKASQENDRVVVSDFVNPTQFAPNEDFESYPRDIHHDTEIAEENGADIIFNPDAQEMYGSDFTTFVNMTGPTEELCGKSRPVHFKGVCTVVSKLFNIVTPDRAYFGQKDAQQLAVIMKMVKDLNFSIEVVACPIIREEDGLAKSSRNNLSSEERNAALILSKSLNEAKRMVLDGEKEVKNIKAKINQIISTEPLARVDYAEVVSFPEIVPLEYIKGDFLVAIAVYIGKTRLIDNFIIENGEEK